MIITSLENTSTWCPAVISLIFVLIMIIIILITHPVGAQPCRGKRGDLFQPDLQHLQHRGTSGLFLCFLLLADFLSAINWHQSSFRYIDWKTLMRALFGDTGTHSSRWGFVSFFWFYITVCCCCLATLFVFFAFVFVKYFCLCFIFNFWVWSVSFCMKLAALYTPLYLHTSRTDWVTNDYQFERSTRQCASGQITTSTSLRKQV